MEVGYTVSKVGSHVHVKLKRSNFGLFAFELNHHLLVIPLLQVCFAIVTIGNGLEYGVLLNE